MVGAVLVGLLAATYVHRSEQGLTAGSQGEKILGGGLLSVFAIGCPVCNKIVVLALGATGALTYFVPAMVHARSEAAKAATLPTSSNVAALASWRPRSSPANGGRMC